MAQGYLAASMLLIELLPKSGRVKPQRGRTKQHTLVKKIHETSQPSNQRRNASPPHARWPPHCSTLEAL